MERLAARLAEVVAEPIERAGAADPECIVVQGRGMERWLAMRLAERFGVWANPDFPFPRKVIRRAVDAVSGTDEERGEAFEPETLTWVIASLLPKLLDRGSFAPLAGYLSDDPLGLRRIGLAGRLAETFDQYAVFRADVLGAWERGDDPRDWQAELWREIVARHGRGHIAARIADLVEALRRGSGAIAGFPVRLNVFGISALPPLYVDALVALSRRIDVHVFVFSPSEHYWGDVRSRREIIRVLVREGRELDEESLHLECGNPLLASLGRLGRDFQGLLESAGDYLEAGPDLYEDPGRQTMLATLQSDILGLRHRREGDPQSPPIPLEDVDGSIAVHACHGPMREIEVLHDQLLDLFERQPDLEPRDVVVLCPEIDAYAPYVDAVFGRRERAGRPRIPHHVADRKLRSTDEVVDAFVRLLAGLRGRMGAAEVLDLLAVEAVRERFEIGAEDLDVLREWTAEAGIRWGVDAPHRLAERGTEVYENTWRFGLDRLLLGHAMRADGRTLFGGVLPFEGAEGNEALLGRFVDFCETLFSLRESLASPRPVARWKEDLDGLLGRMVAATRLNRDQHRRIRRALEALAKRSVIAGFDEAVSLEVVRADLELDLARDVSSGAFLSRGVTFCAFVPMRSIPFRVVCLVGMNDGAFPRIRRPLGFDRLADARRPGDRTPRDDDRYLFLEALLSARDRLLITFVGHGIHDNAQYPPSVVVSELLDALDESFRVGDDPVRSRLLLDHPLQPFSRRYFAEHGDPRLFSYDPAYYEGAERLGQARVDRPPFLARPLPADPVDERVVSIDELARFFENPARGFVRRRLGLSIEDDAPEVRFHDPLEPDALEQWKIAKGLIDCAVRDEDVGRTLAAFRASGRLPHGAPGAVLLDELRETSTEIASVIRPITRFARLPPLVVDEVIGDTRLSGALRNLWPAAQLSYSHSILTARHEIGPWVRHLALCLREPPGLPRVTRLVGRTKDGVCAVSFAELTPDAAAAALRKLIALYWLGQTVPLPFFPNAARAYLNARDKEGEAQALARARLQYAGGRFVEIAEGEDVHVQLVFAGADPLEPSFRPVAEGGEAIPWFGALAVEILGDLTAHREKE